MDHAGPAYLITVLTFSRISGPVAVDRAPGAGGLVLLERAAIEAQVCVLQEGRTGTAKLPPGLVMMSAAVNADHGRYGFLLPLYSALLFFPAGYAGVHVPSIAFFTR
jgi:hypothetical protein